MNRFLSPLFLMRGRHAMTGFLLGALLGLGARQLGLYQPSRWEDLFLAPALLGTIFGLSKWRNLLWAAAILLVSALFVVAYTPLDSYLMPRLVRTDILRPCPAIVVLSAAVHKDGTLNARAQSRILEGYVLLRRRYAPLLVLTAATAPFGSEVPTVRQQMKVLELKYPVEEVGPVATTHDEAVAVARLARQRGWRQVILVTHPWHMRRAAAAFEKAGLPVLCAPCPDEEYDLSDLTTPDARLAAFRDWLHETIGYKNYRFRGWV